MTKYIYAEPKDAAEATARINHWMGDLTEFQSKLGLQPKGYYPQYPGKDHADIEVMIALDMARYPEKWVTTPTVLSEPSRRERLQTRARYLTENLKTRTGWERLAEKGYLGVLRLKARARDRTLRHLLGWLMDTRSLRSHKGSWPEQPDV